MISPIEDESQMLTDWFFVGIAPVLKTISPIKDESQMLADCADVFVGIAPIGG